MEIFSYLIFYVWLFSASLQLVTGEGTCHRTNCKKVVAGKFFIQFASFTKVSDKKFSSSWIANESLSITGSKDAREKKCAKKCMKHEKEVCRSAHLSLYQENSDSTCDLFTEDVYDHLPNVIKTMRENSTGWTSFHLFNSFCERSPCQNDGICKPDFIGDTGRCECLGYSGKYCQHSAKGAVKVSRYDIKTASIDEVLSNPSFPNSPSKVGRIDQLDVTRDVGSNYALRVQSYFVAPQEGEYRFVSACDDQCKVFLSTSDQEADKVEIIYQDAHSSYQQWDKRSNQMSKPVSLVVGQKYYIEIVMRERRGADHLSIGAYFPNGTSALPITSQHLSQYTDK